MPEKESSPYPKPPSSKFALCWFLSVLWHLMKISDLWPQKNCHLFSYFCCWG
jgi:hypothetical protein